ncbi:MAG: hypothetical protein GF375_02745 [Candidatus Omnitrophica bacterium]|nr:hypothetical protein [Candidatus Omnitrophota bacterium]
MSKNKERVIVAVIGLLAAVVMAELAVRVFVVGYTNVTLPEYKDQLKTVNAIFGTGYRNKFLKYDLRCGFLPRGGLFRCPSGKISEHSGDKEVKYLVDAATLETTYYSTFCDYPKKKAEDIRIICVGDSVTFGDGVVYRYSYPAVLERMLNESYPEIKIKVLNAGIPNAYTRQLKRIFQFHLVDYNPDIVIWKKESGPPDTYEVPVNEFNRLRFNIWRFLYSSKLFRTICIILDNQRHIGSNTLLGQVHQFMMCLEELEPAMPIHWMYESDRKNKMLKPNFRLVKRIASESGIKYVLAVDQFNVRKGKLYSDCYEYRRGGIEPLVCTVDVFRNRIKSEDSLSIKDFIFDNIHLTKKGNAFLAKEIFKFIKDEGWIEKISDETSDEVVIPGI